MIGQNWFKYPIIRREYVVALGNLKNWAMPCSCENKIIIKNWAIPLLLHFHRSVKIIENEVWQWRDSNLESLVSKATDPKTTALKKVLIKVFSSLHKKGCLPDFESLWISMRNLLITDKSLMAWHLGTIRFLLTAIAIWNCKLWLDLEMQ